MDLDNAIMKADLFDIHQMYVLKLVHDKSQVHM